MAWALLGFAVVMVVAGAAASRRVDDAEDFVLAGRQLGLFASTSTLFATWFGAGTLLVAADEVSSVGLQGAALDPLGAGVCLLLAGAFLARPLWAMKLTTLPDFYGRLYGPRAELWASVLMVPGYLGWIAAQFGALAVLTSAVTGLDPTLSLVAVAAVGTGYTVMGGMWAVAVTDVLQVPVLVVGLLVLAGLALSGLEPGIIASTAWPTARLDAIEPGVVAAAFFAGALGNLPGQDLAQRLFAARSAETARAACFLAGGAYLSLGALPVLLALVAPALLDPAPTDGVLQAVAEASGGQLAGLAFALAVAAAVLSTIDSAILAPATVIAHNLAERITGRPAGVGAYKVAVVGVGTTSLGLAAVGEDAYALLETSYELGLVSLLVPLAMGLWRPGGARACLASMAVGTSTWMVHLGAGWETLPGTPVPSGLGCAALALTAYLAVRE